MEMNFTHEVWPGFSRSPILQSYKIESRLGSGGNGVIYKAWHKRLRKHLVIKEQKDRTEKAIESHRNEIEALKNIKCMYIPQVFDFHMEDSSSFTIIEYIDGDSFDKLINEGRMFTKPEISKWFYQIACALEVIHKHDICHRDIKPSNIMLMPDGDVCLIDFNAAHVSGNNTRVVNRSLGYASPEQYMYFQLCENFNKERESFAAEPHKRYKYNTNSLKTSTREIDYKAEMLMRSKYAGYMKATPIDWKLSDIYSLGATMYHLLTGRRPPVMADEKTITLNLVDYMDYNFVDLADIIKRSMQTCPKERYPSASELCKALSELKQ